MTLRTLNQALKLMQSMTGVAVDMQRDNHGQIILYTGLMVKPGSVPDSDESELVSFEPQEDILDL